MAEPDRFSRQARFAGIGEEGQQRLGRKHALIVGVGALGSHLAEALTRAGVGELTLVDRDIVEIHNLPRQVLFVAADAEAGRPKAVAAAERLAAIGGPTRVRALTEDFGLRVWDQLQRPDLVLDGTDNFATRYVINDLSIRDGVPWIYAGAVGARGTAMAILPETTPCLRCVMPQIDVAEGELDTCETAGVLQPVIAMVTGFQSAQALKILTDQQDAVARGIFMTDVWSDDYGLRMTEAAPRPDCPVCANHEFTALTEDQDDSVRLCGRNAVQVQPKLARAVDLERLETRLAGSVEELQRTPHLLRFAADGCKFSVFPGGRAILFGVANENRARALYDRYVGA